MSCVFVADTVGTAWALARAQCLRKECSWGSERSHRASTPRAWERLCANHARRRTGNCSPAGGGDAARASRARTRPWLEIVPQGKRFSVRLGGLNAVGDIDNGGCTAPV